MRVVLGIWWDEIYGSDPGRGREGLRAIREGEGEGEEGVGSGPGPGTSGPPPGLLGPEKLVTLVKDLVVQQSKVGVEILRQMRVMNEGEVGEMLKGIGSEYCVLAGACYGEQGGEANGYWGFVAVL